MGQQGNPPVRGAGYEPDDLAVVRAEWFPPPFRQIVSEREIAAQTLKTMERMRNAGGTWGSARPFYESTA